METIQAAAQVFTPGTWLGTTRAGQPLSTLVRSVGHHRRIPPDRFAEWKDSHAKVVKWLLSGKTEKLLRVLLHGENNHSEGHILDSNLNVDSLTDAANQMGLSSVKVTKEVFAKHDKRSVPTMYLAHKLHITGFPAARTVSVFNMPGSLHMAVRDLSTQALIEEGRDTEFAATDATPSPGATAAAELDHRKHQHAKHTHPAPTKSPATASVTSPVARTPTSTELLPHTWEQHYQTVKNIADDLKPAACGKHRAADEQIGSALNELHDNFYKLVLLIPPR